MTTYYTLDAQGRILTQETPDGTKLNWSRNKYGDVTTYTDAKENLTTYTYAYDAAADGGDDPPANQTDDLMSVTAPDQGTISYTYDGKYHNVLTMTQTVDDEGTPPQTTSYGYNPDGELTSVTDPYDATTTYEWNDDHTLQSMTTPAQEPTPTNPDPQPATTTYSYDSNFRLTTTTYASPDPSSDVQYTDSTTYDDNGNIESTTDKNGNVTNYTYSADNQVLEVDEPMGKTTEYEYDPSGLLLQTTDYMDATTKYVYDSRGYQTGEVKAFDTAFAQYSYTDYYPDGSIEDTIDPLQQMTTYDPDPNPANRKVTTTDPIGRQTVTTYDAAGNVQSTTDYLGTFTTYTYDGADRPTNVSTTSDDLGTTNTSTTYDDLGRVTSSTDANGTITRYAYAATIGDGYSVQSIVPVSPGTLATSTQVFDANGNLYQETNIHGGTTTYYYYDDNGRVVTKTLSDPITNTTSSYDYTYDGNGNVLTATDPLGHTTTYEYDALDRLSYAFYPAATARFHDGFGR